MKGFGRISVLVVFFLLSFVTRAADGTGAKIKVTFIYNFISYIEWPESYRQGTFVVAVLGHSPVFNEFVVLANKKKAGQQEFEVKNYISLDGISRCHILYVASDCRVPMKDILAKVKDYSTLIITEKSGMAKQGAAINFVVNNNKQQFELNKSNAEKYKLKVSSSLVNLSIPVK
jgi:Fe-S cluster assembly iron-binding protein IscA